MNDTFATISAGKANNLYWLGRYAERVYLSLHMLRRYYDRMIDGSTADLQEYFYKLSIPRTTKSDEEFYLGQLYDKANVTSIYALIIAANNNAIVLREEIKSESLAYIQLSLSLIQDLAARSEQSILELQPITDYFLAFFGSIYERVFDDRVRDIITIGKLAENIDMHVRFDYPFSRIEEAFHQLKEFLEREKSIYSPDVLKELERSMQQEIYENPDGSGKRAIIGSLIQLMRI